MMALSILAQERLSIQNPNFIRNVEPAILCAMSCLNHLLEPNLDQVRARETALYQRHKLLCEYFANVGNPLSPLPFRGVIYVTEHGDNYFLEYCFTKAKNNFGIRKVIW